MLLDFEIYANIVYLHSTNNGTPCIALMSMKSVRA